MFGPILYRLLIRRVTADGRQISRIVNHVLSGIKCKS
jgi:hypothetical protein